MSANADSRVHSVKLFIKHRKPGEYLLRNSLLTDLFQISHIKCIRNAFFSAMILILSRQMIDDYFKNGRIVWTFDLLRSTVGALDKVVLIWFLMTLSTICLVYAGVTTWIKYRNVMKLFFYDQIALIIYFIYLTLFLAMPCYQVITYRFPLVSSTIILAEQLRQLMKIHSFVREKIHEVFHPTSNIDSSDRNDFLYYVYYVFAPTLIYRSQYPRTSTIRWTYVMNMFTQFIFALICVYHVINDQWLPVFQRVRDETERTLQSTLINIYDMMFPGVLIIIISFYGFFHCWLNAFAEMFRFGDRMFYEDWWNMTSAATFWRSWNIVVHDWLYLYVYKDFHRLFPQMSKLSTMIVVIVSAIFHEYFIIVLLELRSPIIFIWFLLFGILFRFAFPKARGTGWNIFLLTFVPISASVIPYFYLLEISANDQMKSFENHQQQWKSDL